MQVIMFYSTNFLFFKLHSVLEQHPIFAHDAKLVNQPRNEIIDQGGLHSYCIYNLQTEN